MPNARAKSGWFRRPTGPAVAPICRSMLPPFAVWPKIELVRPAVSRLMVQCPVGFSNGAGLDQPVRRKIGHRSGSGAEPLVDRRALYRPSDDPTGYMDILRSDLTPHGLGPC